MLIYPLEKWLKLYLQGGYVEPCIYKGTNCSTWKLEKPAPFPWTKQGLREIALIMQLVNMLIGQSQSHPDLVIFLYRHVHANLNYRMVLIQVYLHWEASQDLKMKFVTKFQDHFQPCRISLDLLNTARNIVTKVEHHSFELYNHRYSAINLNIRPSSTCSSHASKLLPD